MITDVHLFKKCGTYIMPAYKLLQCKLLSTWYLINKPKSITYPHVRHHCQIRNIITSIKLFDYVITNVHRYFLGERTEATDILSGWLPCQTGSGDPSSANIKYVVIYTQLCVSYRGSLVGDKCWLNLFYAINKEKVTCGWMKSWKWLEKLWLTGVWAPLSMCGVHMQTPYLQSSVTAGIHQSRAIRM